MSGNSGWTADRLADVEPILLVGDYSSLEVGVQGDLCMRLFGDDQLIQKYIDQDKKGKNVDIHSSNAREVFGKWLGWKVPASVKVEGVDVICPYAGLTADAIPVQEFKKHPYGEKLRQMIKEIWYGLAYGKGAYGFSTLLGPDGKMIGEERAQQMVDALLDAVPAMRKWMDWVSWFIKKHLGIYSLGGRWCDLADLVNGEEWMFRRAFRRALNFPMQASGAEIIGEAMVLVGRCAKLLELGFRVFLQVHDELCLRGPKKNVDEAEHYLRKHMMSATANGTQLLVGLQVGTGRGVNYYEAK